jgi:hypothetical protein
LAGRRAPRRRAIRSTGGFNPIWSRDGREIFYRRDDEFLVAPVDLEQRR